MRVAHRESKKKTRWKVEERHKIIWGQIPFLWEAASRPEMFKYVYALMSLHFQVSIFSHFLFFIFFHSTSTSTTNTELFFCELFWNPKKKKKIEGFLFSPHRKKVMRQNKKQPTFWNSKNTHLTHKRENWHKSGKRHSFYMYISI